MRFHLAAGAGAGHVDVDGLAVDVDQFDVAVVALQLRPHRVQHHLDALDALQIGQLGRFRFFLDLDRMRVEGLAALGQHLDQNFLDALMAGGAAAAGLGVVDHVLDRGQVVGAHRVFDQHRVDGEALADQRAFFVVVLPFFAAIVGDGGLQRFAAHHRAVHLLRRQTVEIIGDVLVADFQRVVQRHALDDLGQRRAGGDGGAAAEGLEAGVLDGFRLRVHLQHQAQRVAAVERADVADRVGFIQRTGSCAG
jgi:hypothetical protein